MDMNLLDKMDSASKLRRYCFLGSFEPVYIHLRSYINVTTYWPIVEKLVVDINSTNFLQLIADILKEESLVRRDEALFVYAAYLSSSVDIVSKTALRQAFPVLIRTDEDLFLFCKYSLLIGKEQNRRGFSRTVRKAIIAWYEMKTTSDIRTMWLAHRGLHGLTHRILIKLCHISDNIIGSAEVATPFFKTCTELLKESEVESQEMKCEDTQEQSLSSNSDVVKVTYTSDNSNKAKIETLLPNKIVKTPTPLIVAISKLRTIQKKHDAIKIIRKFKLPYTQVPGYWLRYRVVMEALLPTMPYLQILKCWNIMLRYNHFKNNTNILKICKKKLENTELAISSRIHPVHLLLCMHDICKTNLNKLPPKKKNDLQFDYLNKLYKDSFDWPIKSGNLRMHITLNLQSNYKKKMLKNHKNLSYYDACIALSFGYCKREAHVDVFYWYEEKMKLKRLPLEKDYTTQLGFTLYDFVENKTNNQRLVVPILDALSSKQVYDVFLCIVPTAGRGNPKQNSDFLCRFLDKYRNTKNSNAKFIILNLMKFKRSMSYSQIRSENILEICGLDKHTTDIIQNFATHRFS